MNRMQESPLKQNRICCRYQAQRKRRPCNQERRTGLNNWNLPSGLSRGRSYRPPYLNVLTSETVDNKTDVMTALIF